MQEIHQQSFSWPVETYNISSYFGYRIHPITGVPDGYTGLDIRPKVTGVDGDPIYATQSGEVIVSQYQVYTKTDGSTGGAGHYVKIEHTVNGTTSRRSLLYKSSKFV